jgi:hypothetical protein
MGLSPSELFPRNEAVMPFGARSPPDVYDLACTTVVQKRDAAMVRGHVDSRLPALSRAGANRSSSGSFTSSEFVSARSGISRPRGPLLSWGSCLFRVLRRPALGRGVSAVPPPMDLPCHSLPAGLCRSTCSPRYGSFGVSLGPEAALQLSPEGRPS